MMGYKTSEFGGLLIVCIVLLIMGAYDAFVHYPQCKAEAYTYFVDYKPVLIDCGGLWSQHEKDGYAYNYSLWKQLGLVKFAVQYPWCSGMGSPTSFERKFTEDEFNWCVEQYKVLKGDD